MRRLMLWVAVSLVALVTGAPVAALGGSSAPVSDGSGLSLSVAPGAGQPVPLVQPLVEGDRADAPRPATPPANAAAARRSRTRFGHLDAAHAAQVANEVFPAAIDRVAGGPPSLPAGQRVSSFISSNAAQLELPGGKHAVVVSTQPMSVETSPRHRAPLDLRLTKAGDSYQSVRPLVGVLIPQHLADGIQLPQQGVSLTAVDPRGAALAGSEGRLEGSSVLYANTQTDTDTTVKPIPDGVEANTILRSVDSPRQLYFRVGMDAGASLQQAPGGVGPVTVVRAGQTLAVIRPPSALDAAGASVPVSMRAQGDEIVLAVAAEGSGYQWPIMVDPEVVTDHSFGPSECHVTGEPERISSNWCWHASPEASFKRLWFSASAEMYNVGGVSPGAYTVFAYHTQGESKIYKVEVESAGKSRKGRAKLEIARNRAAEEGEVERSTTIAEAPEVKAESGWGLMKTTVCANAECSTSGGSNNNIAAFKLEATEPIAETYNLDATMQNAYVYISQEKFPVPSFNESEATLSNGRTNVLYGAHGTGAGTWLSPYSSTAFEVKGHDPGVGIAWGRVGLGSWSLWEPIYESGKCNGIQCNENFSTLVTYNPAMVEGEQSIEWYVANLVGRIPECPSCLGQTAHTFAQVKVDGKAPTKLEVSGWGASREISAAPHALTVSATDEAPFTENHSSGVKSIAVSIDGGSNTEVSGASCSLGTCAASGKYTLNAEALSEGVHRLVVTATDNAKNVAAKEFTFDVRHGTPVAVGPGTVDSVTGQFKLTASDVSLASAGAVSRVYESRNTNAGLEGPLGPQWAVSLGGGEGLTVLPTGSVVLSGPSAGTTTFLRNEKGEFLSPEGDSNLKIEGVEPEAGKGVSEYRLLNSSAGTTTRFTQPPGVQNTTPTYTAQFGAEATELTHPVSDAIDAAGNVWVTDSASNRTEEFSAAGSLLHSNGSYGSASGQFSIPWGIAVNQHTENVYVTDQGNNRIEEFSSSGAFIRAIGWGVTDGKSEAEVCTATCQAGIAGSGNGQVSGEAGIAIDASGNVWVADYGNSRIQEFTENGSYIQKFGSEGAGNGQFKGPTNIAFSGGKVYVTDSGNNRVQKFSTAGVWEATIGEAGTGNGKFTDPYSIAVDPKSGNLYVADYGNKRVQELSAAGAYIAKFGTSGSGPGQFTGPTGVAVNSSGSIYAIDVASSRVEEWTRPSWLPTLSEGAVPGGTTAYAYETAEVEEKTIIQPTEALAPQPTGVSCGTKPSELKRGCRALTFKYATATTATGEKRNEWGEYKGRLIQVIFHAYNTTSSAMEEIPVAQYSYDKLGRLRAEWDPRISPELKMTYGYDAEGHLTAMTPPGEETWAFTYGTIPGDPNTGRLLKVTRAPASAALWNGEPTKLLGLPKLTGTPMVGVSMGVSSTGWLAGPVAFAFQWEDCNAKGEACTAIPGATNQNYTVTTSDVGHTLVAKVSGINGGGSGVGTGSLPSSVVLSAGALGYNSQFGAKGTATGKFSEPEGIAIDTGGHIWVADTGNGRLQEFSEKGEFMKAITGLASPAAVATDNKGHIWVTESSNHRIKEYSEAGTAIETIITAEAPVGLAVNSTEVWSTQPYAEKNRVRNYNTLGKVIAEWGAPGSGNGQLEWPQGIALDGKSHVWVSDTENNRLQEFNLGGGFVKTLASYKSGEGEVSFPHAVTIDSHGNIWVADTGHNALEEFSESGTFLTKTGSVGSGEGQLSAPRGVVIDSKGNAWVADTGNSRIEKFSPIVPVEGTHYAPGPGTTLEYHLPLSGTGLPTMTKAEVEKWGQKNDVPTEGMAVFPPDEPQTWPASSYKRATIDYLDEKGRTVDTETPGGGIATLEYNEANETVRSLSADNRAQAVKEAEPAKAAEKLDTKTEYNASGSEILKTEGPEHKVRLSSGAEVQARLVSRNYYNEGAKAVEEKTHETYNLLTKTTTAALTGGKEEDMRELLTSYGGQENLGWKLRKATSNTQEPAGLNLTSTTKYDPISGNVTETTSPAGAGTSAQMVYDLKFGSQGKKEGQFETPEGVAVDGKTGYVYVADYALNRVEKFTAAGAFVSWVGSETSGSGEGQLSHPESVAVSASGNLYVGDAGNHRVEEFNSEGKYVRAFGKEGTGEGQFGNAIYGLAFDANGKLWVTDGANHRVEEFSETGTFERKFGEKGTTEGKFEEPRGIAVYGGDLYIADSVNGRVEEFDLEGKFVKQFASVGLEPGQLREPWGIAVDGKGDLFVADRYPDRVEEFSSSGKFLAWLGSSGTAEGQFEDPDSIGSNAAGDVYVVDQLNHRVQEWAPGNQGAHSRKTIYYTAAPNTEYKNCGERPEWANLPCMTKAAAQPETNGLPELPTTTMTYNIWDEVETTSENFGTTTRTKTEKYDGAGRAETSEEATSPVIDTALPKVTNEYNSETGLIVKQSTTVAEKTQSITSVFNTLGQMVKYTDADGNVTTYVHDPDGRVEEVNDGKGTQIYAYDETTGFLTKLLDTAAGTFTASYDAEGKMLTENYPNGMTATSTYDPTGTATGIEYVKTTHCTEHCTWFSDTAVASIHGETLAQTSTLSKELYTYDNAGRLLQTQETPAGKTCTTRIYTYDSEADRTGLTERQSGTEACATEGGWTQPHDYDTANRLTDAGVSYEAFGNITKMSAEDAGGSEGGHELKDTYYVDNQIASQEQNGETINYKYDPSGRARETVSTGKTAATVISHYSGPGGALAWTSEGETWTRNIPGIDGALDAIQPNGGTPVLQLHDLKGNIVGTAALSETETKLLSSYNSTEFGVPTTTTPPKYSWLGAGGVSTETSLSSGVSTEGGASYVPQVARSLQTQPVVPPGAFPNGQGTGAQFGSEIPGWYISLSAAESAATIAEYAAKQKAREEEACRAAPLSCMVDFGDPPPKISYLTLDEAAILAYNIKEWIHEGNESAIIGFFFDLKGFAEESLESIVSGDADKKYDEFLEGKLDYCVKELEFWGATSGGCRVSQPTVAIGEICVPTGPESEHCANILTLPDLSKDPEVSMCGYFVVVEGHRRLGECIYIGPGFG